ncbi:PfkB family carbohydrate kinase [Pararhizobium sp. IMCC21322]|uniref:PfkB family carbohydrate kinase n=1 Tax=Pararhizobium sp. IMCC21322 TaxID=3067903 RepID=UPI002741AF5C|nr:PfkB family carbohydrate kinase [Pararhizobium sp. IMCC21322]
MASDIEKDPIPVSFCVFGGALIDRIGTFKTAFHSGQSHPGHWQQTVGGVAANGARHLAHFGAKVIFATVFADDFDARTVRNRLLDDGLIIVPDCIIPGGATPTYTVMHDPSGDVIAGLADMALHQHMDEAWARNVAMAGSESTHWIADTNIAPAALTELAQLKGNRKLFLMVVSPAKTAGLMPLLRHLDGIICNRQEAEALADSIFPDAPCAAKGLAALGIPLCIVSDGAKASALACRTPDRSLQLTLKTPLPIADETEAGPKKQFRMTGAGDMFAAACLFALCTKTAIAPGNVLRHGHAAARLAMMEEDSCPTICWRAVTDAADQESNNND